MRQAPFWSSLEAIAPTLAYDHAGIMGPTGAVPSAELAQVAVPVLALCGGASLPFMCATARTISVVAPQGQWRTLEGQGHAAQPAALAPVLIEFLGAAGG